MAAGRGAHRIGLCTDAAPPEHAPQRRLDLGDSHLMGQRHTRAIAAVSELPLLFVDELDASDLPRLPAALVALEDGDRLI